MQSILNWYRSGGPFIAPLMIVGALGILLLVERLAHLVVRSRIHSRPFIERVISLTRAGKVEEALALCAAHQSALPDLGLLILRSGIREEADLRHVADAAALTLIPGLRRRLGWLAALAHVSVLLGLVGGIANLHDSLVGGVPLNAAIAYALRPVGVGILTAIPLTAGQAYLASAAERLSAYLSEFSTRLINTLLERPDVRLGHRD